MTRTVLYIDDSSDNLRLVERLLSRRPDVELRVAMTGRDGVSAAIDDPPALILLDNRLPDASGKQVLSELAGTPATAAIPVVILSGDSGRATMDELLAAGAAEYLAKPFDIDRFMAVIGRHL
jgi:DNA-binding response OmpR family regulator